ncbi:MAG: SGNH/GDSL hydrolase family protein [Deltaproteobacteria bacterium]|nr:SGNH/GDSL hydrolase family protein [Deltaproteobacteria bacterium]
MDRKGRKKLVGRVLLDAVLVIGSSVFLLLVLELCFRLVFTLPPGHRQVWRNTDLVPTPEPDMEFINRPRGGTDPVCNQGFRGTCPVRKKRPGIYRIAVIGDSVTYGEGVPGNEAYPARLRSLLERRLSKPVEVINAGTPGYDIVQAVAMYSHRLVQYSPDVVVYGCFSNDLETQRIVVVNNVVVGVVPDYSLMPGEIWLPLWLHERLSRSSYLYDWINFRLLGFLTDDPRILRDTFNDTVRMRAVKALKKLKAEAGKRGTALLVALLPVVVRRHRNPARCGDPGVDSSRWRHYCLYNDRVLDYVRGLCNRLDIKVADLRLAYVDDGAESVALSREDPNHPNPKGHELLARALAGPVADLLGR